MSIHNVNVSAAETGRIIDEALELRKKRQALLVQEREPDLKLIQPIPFFTYVVFSVCNTFIWSYLCWQLCCLGLFFVQMLLYFQFLFGLFTILL